MFPLDKVYCSQHSRNDLACTCVSVSWIIAPAEDADTDQRVRRILSQAHLVICVFHCSPVEKLLRIAGVQVINCSDDIALHSYTFVQIQNDVIRRTSHRLRELYTFFTAWLPGKVGKCYQEYHSNAGDAPNRRLSFVFATLCQNN